MIKINNKTISKIYKGETPINKIYKGNTLIWQSYKTLTYQNTPPIILQNCKNDNILNYKIYGNSVQDGTPSLSNPVEIKSVGDKTKNLMSFNGTITKQSLVLTSKGSDMTLNGTSSQNLANDYSSNNNIKLEPGTYKMSYHYISGTLTKASPFYIGLFNTSNNWYPDTNTSIKLRVSNYTSTMSISITVSETTYLCFHIVGNGTADNLKFGILLEENNIVTSYEPYGKYKIPVNVSSPNLLPYPYILESRTYGGIDIIVNDDGSIKLNGTATGFNATVNTFRLKAGTYAISGNPSPDVNLWLRVVGSTTSAYYVRNYNGIKGTLTIAEDSDMYVYITINTGDTVNNVTIYPMVNDGIMDLEYSKYFTPVTTNIYLDEPLRKIGDGIPSRLPEGYTPLGYIETASDSFRSFITTDIPLNTISYIEFEYKLLNTVSQHPMVFSSYTSSSIQSVAPYICVDGVANGSWIITPKINKSSQEKTKYMITNNNTSTNLLKIGGWTDNYWTAKGRYYYVKIYDKNNKFIKYG